MREYFERYLLEPYVIDLTTDLKIPSMAGILIDRTGVGPAVSVGLKSSLNPREAIVGSLLEAQHVRGWMRFTYYNINKYPKITEASAIVDLKTRGLYWYDQEKIKLLDFWLKKEKNILNERNYLHLNLGELKDYLIQKKIDIYTVEISTPFIKEKGFFVIKSIIPQLHPLSLDEDLPYLYGERLSRYITDRGLNIIPHPFL